MELQKINVKFFAVENEPVPLTAFIDVFHSWIQASDGTYHDVADYSHMRAGPGIVLVAHEMNVSIDETGGRRGLLYNRKAPLQGSNPERLREVFRSALKYCCRVEGEPALKGRIIFRVDEAEVTFNDRLLAPNTVDAFVSIKADLELFFRQLYGTSAVSLERDEDPRRRLNVQVKTPAVFDIATLQSNLERSCEEPASRTH